MSGPNADFHSLWNSFLSYDHVDRQMQAGEVVRVDVGCQVDHYMGDVGRTAPVSGNFTEGQREAWDLFIAGYRAGLSIIEDEVSAKAVYDAALAEVRRRAPALTTLEGRHAAETLLGPHGTEAWQLHGVGLDDAEGLPEVLRAGMAVAYELMFTVDGDGFYLEDMIVVTRSVRGRDAGPPIYRGRNRGGNVDGWRAPRQVAHAVVVTALRRYSVFRGSHTGPLYQTRGHCGKAHDGVAPCCASSARLDSGPGCTSGVTA